MSKILHISDPHFSEDVGRFLYAKRRDDWADAVVEKLIIQKWIPDVIVISGDLTYAGDVADFDVARTCIEQLRGLLQQSGTQSSPALVIVPGNHDIRWKVDGEPAKELQRLAGYRSFQRTFFQTSDINAYDCTSHIGDDLIVVGLNSARIETEETAGLGYVGQEQLQVALRPLREATTLGVSAARVAVLHHHLLPVVWSERLPDVGRAGRYSLTLDAEAVQQKLIDSGVELVLHGHQHQPFIREIIDYLGGGRQHNTSPRRLIISAAGSVSVARSHLGYYGRNHFQTIEVTSHAIEFTYYSSSLNNPYAFIPDDPIQIPRRSRFTRTLFTPSRRCHISISGAMSVGKATLARGLSNGRNDIIVLPDIGRTMLARARGADKRANDEDYLEYLRLHFCNMARNDHPISVHIRSIIDVYAYARIDGSLKDGTVNAMRDAARLAASFFDLIAYIPIEEHVPITADGARSIDKEYRSTLDESIRLVFTELGIEFVEITGSVEERVSQIQRALNGSRW